MGELVGEIALVTGASRGIGRAIARTLADAGARVAGVGRNAATIEAAMAGLDRPGQAMALVADLTQPAEIHHCLAAVEGAWDFPGIIVHAAGCGGFTAVDRLDPAAWEAGRAINLDAVVYLATATLPRLAARGRGHFVAVNSIAALQVFPGASAYCAAKAGARAFLNVARQELRRSQVRLTTIIAGSVDTEFWESNSLGLDRSQMLQAEDIADAVLFALSASPCAAVDEIQVLPRLGIL